MMTYSDVADNIADKLTMKDMVYKYKLLTGKSYQSELGNYELDKKVCCWNEDISSKLKDFTSLIYIYIHLANPKYSNPICLNIKFGGTFKGNLSDYEHMLLNDTIKCRLYNITESKKYINIDKKNKAFDLIKDAVKKSDGKKYTYDNIMSVLTDIIKASLSELNEEDLKFITNK